MSTHREDQYVGPYRLEKTLGKGQTGMSYWSFNYSMLYLPCKYYVKYKCEFLCNVKSGIPLVQNVLGLARETDFFLIGAHAELF